jgi:hypothetical protein
MELITKHAETRYKFSQHTRRMNRFTLVSGVLFLVCAVLVGLAFANALPNGLGSLVTLAGVVGIICLVLLIPLLLFTWMYLQGGLWLDEQGVRVRFPAEQEQEIQWADVLYAVDEGEEFLIRSKGKEGLGHLVGKTHYVRLHLEGMTPEQRMDIWQKIAEQVEIRIPEKFTFSTLLNSKGETVARGRLYLFGQELLCMENRGQKRVFIAAPIRKLAWVKARAPFYIGRLECEAFTLYYDKTEYIVMLGYETTIRTGLGSTSRWSATGLAEEWIEALQVK